VSNFWKPTIFPTLDPKTMDFICGAKTTFNSRSEEIDLVGHFQFWSQNDINHWGKTVAFPINLTHECEDASMESLNEECVPKCHST
jgi:hypothetical protein